MQLTLVNERVPKVPSSKQKKSPGRPYSGGRERTANLQIRVTPEEHDCMMQVAKAGNTTISEIFRKMLSSVEREDENAIPILIKNQPTYLTREQAKDLFSQLTKILI